METFWSFVTFDIVVLIILLGFAGWGFANGLIRAVGGIIGIIVATFLTGRYYLWLADLAGPLFGPFQGVAKIVAFAFLFLLIGRLFGLLVYLIEKAFDIMSFIPFLKSINRLLGAIFGFILGALILGTLLYIISKYSQWTAFNDAVQGSQLAEYLMYVGQTLRPLFPQALRELQSYF